MISIPPSTLTLKSSLWQCLREKLDSSIELSNLHPTTLEDVEFQGGRVVISEQGDRTISRQLITSVASSPVLQFSCYHSYEFKANELMELVDELIRRKCCCIKMKFQKLDHVQRRQWMPTRFIEQVSLYHAACVFEFFLQRIGE